MSKTGDRRPSSDDSQDREETDSPLSTDELIEVSADQPSKKVHIVQEDKTRGLPKSGRWWKEVRTSRTSAVKRKDPKNQRLVNNYAQRVKLKQERARALQLQREMKEEKRNQILEKKRRREENERRRLENEKKAEIVQKISTRKAKRLTKKQWRQIETR